MMACTILGPSICDFHSPPFVWVHTKVSHSSDEIIQPNYQYVHMHIKST